MTATVCDDRRVTAQPDAAAEASALPSDTSLGESRWPPAVALIVFMGANIALRV